MSIAFNQVTIAGNLTRDPELRSMPNGQAVTGIGLAINETYKDKSGEKRERVDFVDVEFFARTAEVVCQYCHKGDPILVSGRLRLDQWEKDGQKNSKLKVIGDRMQMLGGRRSDSTPQSRQPEPTNDFSDTPF